MNAFKNSGSWSKHDLLKFLSELDYAYLKIDLPYGLSTKGFERKYLLDLAFDENLKGKTVLDIGSHLGYFCLEACERGAEKVVGLELDSARVKEAQTIADIKGLKPEYRISDVEGVGVDEKYDIVLCLNILHHLFDPINVLHKLAKITRETLILEVTSLGRHDSSKVKLPQWLIRFLRNKPVMIVREGRPEIGVRAESQKFFFSEQALLNILNNHTKLFAKVETYPSDFKDHFIIKATRRKIGHLIIVAGPTSSGKSSFLKALSENHLKSELINKLPVQSTRWPQVGASKLLKKSKTVQGELFQAQQLEGLFLHYDILRPFTTGTHGYERDQALDLIYCADSVTVLTLKPPKDKLLKQLLESELNNEVPAKKNGIRADEHKSKSNKVALHSMVVIKRWVKKTLQLFGLMTAKKKVSHHQKLYFLFQDENWLESWYESWAHFIKEKRKDSFLVTVIPEPDQDFKWKI